MITIGLGALCGLQPSAFWAMTPREFALARQARPEVGADTVPDRRDLARLMAAFRTDGENEMDENVTVRIEADTAPFVAALDELQQLSQGFGAAI